MAKRRKAHHTKRTHRKRHHSGINGLNIKSLTPVMVTIGEGVAGAIAASFVQSKLLANFHPDKPMLAPLLIMGVGAAAGITLKNPHIKAVAMGMATYGGLQVAKATIPGIGDLMIGDLDGMMENLMIGTVNESLVIGAPEYNIEDDVISNAVVLEDEVMM